MMNRLVLRIETVLDMDGSSIFYTMTYRLPANEHSDKYF